MTDVLERLRNVVKSNEGRIGSAVVSVTLQTVVDAVGELDGLRGDVRSADAEAAVWHNEAGRLAGEIAELKKKLDRLTLLVSEQSATIDRLRRAIPVDEQTAPR